MGPIFISLQPSHNPSQADHVGESVGIRHDMGMGTLSVWYWRMPVHVTEHIFFPGSGDVFLPAAVVSCCALRQVRACLPCWRVGAGNVGERKDNEWQWQWE